MEVDGCWNLCRHRLGSLEGPGPWRLTGLALSKSHLIRPYIGGGNSKVFIAYGRSQRRHWLQSEVI